MDHLISFVFKLVLVVEVFILSCAFFSDYKDFGTDKTVKFSVSMSEEELASAEQEGLTKKFKLECNINCSSMVCH